MKCTVSDHCVEKVFIFHSICETPSSLTIYISIFHIYIISYIKVILSIHNAKKLQKWLHIHQINIPCSDTRCWLKYPNLQKLKEKNLYSLELFNHFSRSDISSNTVVLLFPRRKMCLQKRKKIFLFLLNCCSTGFSWEL